MPKSSVKLTDHAKLLLVCSSCVNLSLLPMWMHYKSDYLEPLPYPELVGIVMGFGVGLFAVAWLLHPLWDVWVIQLLTLFLFLVFPLDGIRQALGLSPRSVATTLGISSRVAYKFTALAVPVLLLAMWFQWRQKVFAAVRGLAIILSPLLLFCGALAVSRTGPASESFLHYADSAVSRVPAQGVGPVFLLVFDEADYGFVFERRPAELELPYLDVLARRSVHFLQAYSPGRDTILSLPALLMGESLKHVHARGSNLGVTTATGVEWDDWLQSDHLLHARHSATRRTAVIGFYHPYCLIPELAYCTHHRVFPYRRWAFDVMPAPIAALQSNPLVKPAFGRYIPETVKWFADFHQKLFDDLGDELLALPANYDLVFAHLNMPHPTAVPVAAIRRFGKLRRADYFANLRRTDEFLRRFVEGVTSRHTGANPVIIVTSDHGLRYASWAGIGYDVSEFSELATRSAVEDFHVPFLIHFPASQKGIEIEKPVNNLHIKGLVEAIFAGTVHDEAEAARSVLAERFQWPVVKGPSFSP